MTMTSNMYTILILYLIIFNYLFAENNEAIIRLPYGLIKGQLTNTQVVYSNKQFYSFLGVPYAQPPIGKARFLAPLELLPWDDIYDATYERDKCYQLGEDPSRQSEECLHLNVFTPKFPIENVIDPLPVMVFIPGGGYFEGSGQIAEGYGPDFFMDHGVILVSINYRLGPFGFFSTGDDVIPGNAGLKDQNMALKWVKENIKYFGGDPNRITIFGESAGSSSISYHLISKKSAGLFQAAILQSGSALSPWAYQRNQVDITYATATQISSSVDIFGISSTDFLNFLQTVDAESINNAAKRYIAILDMESFDDNVQIQQGYYYAPVIEPEGADAFLTQSMYNLYESGDFFKVPVIIGTNAEEFLRFYNNNANFTRVQRAFDENVTLSVPYDMHLSGYYKTIVGELIKKEYIGEHSTWSENLAGTIQYFSHQSFVRSIIKQAELQSKFSEVYFYVFSYHGIMGLNFEPVVPGLINVGHGEELPYLFPQSSNGFVTSNLTQFPAEDVMVHYRFLSLWTNFAKHFNPTPVTDGIVNVLWPKVNLEGDLCLKYLDIGENLAILANPWNDKIHFWQDLYHQYAVRPYDTY